MRELLHDGHPTACIGDAAFAYINAFRAHVNVGPGRDVDAAALTRLIQTAYADMQERLKA